MAIVLAIYAGLIWLVFFQFKLLPWSRATQAIVAFVGLVIVLVVVGLLNTKTPSGRVTIVAQVNQIAPVVGGIVADVPVTPNVTVEAGTVLMELDKRPFQYAVDEADAAAKIAAITLERQETVYEKSATVSKQDVDESRAAFAAAEARLATAQYNLEQATIVAPETGVATSIGLSVGDQAQPNSPVIPFIRTDSLVVAGVFNQNGLNAMPIATEVKLVFDRLPGQIFTTQVVEIVAGTASGQLPIGAELFGASDIGSGNEALVLLAWPEGLDRDVAIAGNVGSATAFGPDAGAMGMLATILLYAKMLGT
ncbi:MAG: biotin/lipoyl-binding protein, partial [Pseudomonadales bacterium]